MNPVAVRDRAALARAVLARAEERTGTTRWMRPTPSPAPVGPLAPGAPVDPLAPGARGPSVGPLGPDVVPGRPGAPAPVPAGPTSGEHVLPVAPIVAGLLPSGGLDRGAAVVVGGSTTLVLALVAEASRAGSWVGLVGLPRVGLLAAHQMGLDLDRVVLVPAPGPDGPTVVAALLDGVDVVVVGEVALDDRDRRRLSARARERGAVLLSTASWPGAQVVLTVEVSRWDGLGRGHGRLRERRLTVQGGGRGSASRGWQAEVTLPVGRVARRVERAREADAVRPLQLWDGRRAG